jgi:hypothetical protein
MAEELMKSASLEKKKVFNLPKGAEIISKEVRVNVREIENGFLLDKSYDVKWKMKGDKEGRAEYEYFSKTWFSKDNPITYKEPKDISLAEKLD